MTSFRTLSSAFLVLVALGATPAAAAALSYVSGKGVDAGDCSSPRSPCRSFQYALGKTSSGGEVKALDAANYYAAIINKSVTITGVPGANITRSSVGAGISVRAGASDSVYLRNLEINGLGGATFGLQVLSAGNVSLVDSVVRGFLTGVYVYPTSGVPSLFLTDTLVTESRYNSIELRPQNTSRINAFLTRVRAIHNYASGLALLPRALAMVTDSVLEFNSRGVDMAPKSTVRLARNTISGNRKGVRNGGVASSYGDNKIDGNDEDVTAPMGIISTR